jgi:large subunit ribosomal protein L21
MSRSLLRSVLELRTPLTRLPPSFLLPIQARRPQSTTSTTATSGQVEQPPAAPIRTTPAADAAIPIPTAAPTEARSVAAAAELYPKQPQLKVEPSPEARSQISQLLPLLRAQPSHYITAHIWGRPYLVTAGDQIRLPFHMPGVLPGDVLRLDRASTLGSRDYTLKGAPFVDERLFECRATVLGTETEPLRTKLKTKRRQRKTKTVRSKHRYTILRVSELVLRGPEAVGL